VTLAKRFWKHVEIDGVFDCWRWAGRPDKDGYGRIREGGVGSRTLKAHRVAWALHHGRTPEDNLFVCHRCDNPPCVNPAHLFIGTNSDNMADMVGKGRQARGDHHGARLHPESRPRGERSSYRLHPERFPRGEASNLAKVTQQAVDEIRHGAEKGTPQRALAKAYGLSKTQIARIIHGLSWRQEHPA
jgi:hypothetical protein